MTGLSDTFGWGTIGVVVPVLIGIGVGVMSMTPPEFGIAKIFLTTAAVVLCAKTLIWLIATDASRPERILVGLLILGLGGPLWVESWRWIDLRKNAKRTESVVYPIPPVTTPIPQAETRESAPAPEKTDPPKPQRSTIETRTGIPPGPLPRYTLGGGLDKDSLVDIMMSSAWLSVPQHRDVFIDWADLPSIEILADLMVRVQGVGQVGIMEVTNGVPVAMSEPVSDSGQYQLPQPRNVRFQIPHAAGRKTYRLVVRRAGPSAATLWATGELILVRSSSMAATEKAPEKHSLGGDLQKFFHPVAEPFWAPVDGFIDVELDWSRLETATVVAQIELAVYAPVHNTPGSAFARIRELREDRIVITSDPFQRPR